MSPVVRSLCGLLCLAVVVLAREWAPMEMHNPEANFEDCNQEQISGRGTLYMMCDPDKILKRSQVRQVNWLLRDAAANSTRCPCSNHFCEKNMQAGFTGYHIGVALIKKMKLEDDVITGKPNNPRDQAMLFARTLERESWRFGNCEDDIIIFYSVEDKELAVHTGKTAAMRLTSDARLRLMQTSQRFFAENKIIEGINTLVVNMRGLLACDAEDINTCELIASGRLTGAAGLVSTSVTLILASLLMTLYNMF